MSIRGAIPPRSVHLMIRPRPSNLSESREIFRVMQRFGEISTFKNLRYEYQNPARNVALAIYRDEAAAQQALNASPIRFALEKIVPIEPELQNSMAEEEHEISDDALSHAAPTPALTKAGIDDMLRPSQFLNRARPSLAPHSTSTSDPASSMPFDPPPSRTSIARRNWSKWFEVIVDRSHVVHQDFIERQPFWKQFEPMKSMAQADLAKQVPHIGLSDVSKRPPNAHRTPIRVLKVMNDYVENNMPTLKGMADNNEMERRFRVKQGL